MFKRVLVTLDGSKAAEAVLKQVERLGSGVKVTLFAVGEPAHATSEIPHPLYMAGAPAPGGVVAVPGARTVETRDQAFQQARDHLTGYLQGKAEELRAKDVDVDVAVGFGEPVEEILAAAREKDVDLIMMATHGRSALARVAFGSVASRVVGSGVRPVLLVRPTELKGGE